MRTLIGMSVRLYYDDAYMIEFTARVVAQHQQDGRQAVILDRSCFYPTSGGQPHDKGWLNDTAVTHVTTHHDNSILHWLAAPLEAETVNGRIDWPRRFDHMQQHTGQHLLSRAFIQIAAAETVGFHLTDDNLTIDLECDNLTPSHIEQAESLANQIVWENRPVSVRTVTLTEARQLKLRKLPDLDDDAVRLVEIENFDVTACGGTHVAHTGSVGLLKVIKQERRGSQQRLTFVCGQRAAADYGHKHDVVEGLMANLTTAAADLETAVTRLQADLKQANRRLKQQSEQLIAGEAQQLLATAVEHDQLQIVNHLFTDRDPGQLRQLASQLVQQENTIALLGLAGPKSQLIFARASDAPGAMNQLLSPALSLISPTARGGGSDVLAQGGGPAASPSLVRQALDRAQQILLDTL